MGINIENPNRLVNFVEQSLTSWKIEYIGRGIPSDIYYYNLMDKTNRGIKIIVEIHSETQQLYNPESFQPEDGQYVKIHCKNVKAPQKKGCTKFLRVEEFRDIRRVFNYISDGARQVLQ